MSATARIRTLRWETTVDWWRYTVPGGDDADRTAALLHLAGAGGVWDRGSELIAWFTERVVAVPPGGTWRVEADRDWSEQWKAGLAPVRIGRLVIAPSWAVPDSGEPIVIDPGMAFGTGHHATTRGCLAALQRRPLGGRGVLDVGTGSGILAIAAARLGASPVVAVDADREALAVARGNVSRNRVEVELRAGSVAAGAKGGPFDVVVANLSTRTVLELLDELVSVTAPGGRLVLGGVSDEGSHGVRSQLAARDVRLEHDHVEAGWVTLTVTRAGRPRRRSPRAPALALIGALALAGCTTSSPTPPDGEAASPGPSPNTAVEPRLQDVVAQLDAATRSLHEAAALLDAAATAETAAAVRERTAGAVGLLTADPELGSGTSSPDGSPFLPAAAPDGRDVLSQLLAAVRSAGTSASAVASILDDPVAGDVTGWQRRPDEQLRTVSAAAASGSPEDVGDLEGQVPQALAWALVAADAPDDGTARTAATRAAAHARAAATALEQARSSLQPGATQEPP